MSEKASALYSPSAEKALLGIAVQNSKYLDMVCGADKTALFANPQHQRVQEGMTALHSENAPADLVTLESWLNKKYPGTDWLGLLMACVDAGFLDNYAPHYVKILQECAYRRALKRFGEELTARAAAEEDPDELEFWALKYLDELKASAAETEGNVSLTDACTQTYGALSEDQRNAGKSSKRIMSGIETLDKRLGGFQGGQYIAIGARPSVGKSILALTFCMNAALQGKRVLLVSLEMDPVQITERILANRGNLALHKITSGNIDNEGWERLGAAIMQVSRLPIWVNCEADTVDKVRRSAHKLYKDGGLDLIAVDYLQLMSATDAKKQNRQEQIAEISRGLRKLAAEMDVPVIVLTQLNRSNVSERVDYQRTRREPTMSDARESGAIEQDANVFILLHNPSREELAGNEQEQALWDTMDRKGYTMLRIIVDKNRQGKCGRLTVAFDGDHMAFIPVKESGVGT